MNDERLDNIQKGFENSSEYRGKLILELISEVRMLRKLVQAVDNKYDYPIACWDVDGKNWFDAREEALS